MTTPPKERARCYECGKRRIVKQWVEVAPARCAGLRRRQRATPLTGRRQTAGCAVVAHHWITGDHYGESKRPAVRVDDTIIWAGGYYRKMTRRERLAWQLGLRMVDREGGRRG